MHAVGSLNPFSLLFQFQILCKSRIGSGFRTRARELCECIRGCTSREGDGEEESRGMTREKSAQLAGIRKERSGRAVAGGVTLDDVVLDIEGVAGPSVVVTGEGTLEKEDCVEWEVFNNERTTSTASIRHRLFERSISVRPEK